MKQYQFIVPERRDSDKQLHSFDVETGLHDSLLAIAGGFTVDHVTGFWKNSDGHVVTDSSLRYTIAIARGNDGALRHIVRSCLETFDQKCIYFARPDGFAELLS